MPDQYITVADALAELRPFYPRASYATVAGGRIYLNDGTQECLWARPSFGDVHWDAVCVAIGRAVPGRRVVSRPREDDSTWPPYR